MMTPPRIPPARALMRGWSSRRIEIEPPAGYWAFNPSVVRLPDGRWLCCVRTANYHLAETAGGTATMPELGPDKEPTGKRVPQGRSMPKTVFNRNHLVELDPITWKTIWQSEIEEKDGRQRETVFVRGYDDLRLAWTARDRLVAIANVAHFNASAPREMCVLDLDEQNHIARATPLRGAWSEHPQKNWTPFVGTGDLRLVYSVERGGLHTRAGRIMAPRARRADGEAKAADAGNSVFAGPEQITLRGGSQLVQLPRDDRWIGIAHGVSDGGDTGMHYWHVWYTTDRDGRMLEQSRPFKLSEAKIEFAAGISHDPTRDELVVSYGMGDDTPMLGTVPRVNVLRLLRAIPGMPQRSVPRRHERV